MRALIRLLSFLPFGVALVLAAGLALSLASLAASIVWFAISRAFGRRRPGYWRRVGRVHLVLVPLFFLVGEPILVTSFATSFETRPDEIGYRGPRLGKDGAILAQTRITLDDERRGKATVDPQIEAEAEARAVHFDSDDGVNLRAFHVAARASPPRFAVVLAHGLFRGALEIEPVGAMFRELGGDVLLLELRNHGRSGHTRPTFGRDESKDVVAAARWLRKQVGPKVPLVLFGVSLGSAATAIAAPAVEREFGLDGLVLDSTMASLDDTARHFLEERMELPNPWRALTIFAVETFTGVPFDHIRPGDAVARLAPTLPSLIIGGGDDVRTPPAGAREVFGALAAPQGTKEIWIREGSDHGHVWLDAPVEYEAHLRAFVDRVVSAAAH